MVCFAFPQSFDQSENIGLIFTLGSIELNIATMEKIDRCRNEHVYTSSFVPERDLPNRTPTALDPQDGFSAINKISEN